MEENDEFLNNPRKSITKTLHGFQGSDDEFKNNFRGNVDKKNCQFTTENILLKPSEYMRQLSLTMEERIESLKKEINLPGIPDTLKNLKNCPDFEIVPHIVFFQHYTSGNVYNFAVTIRNTSKVSRYLKLTKDVHPNFITEYKETTPSINTRLAPGMFTIFNVRFSPDENRDYEHRIKFTTDREFLTVPIIAIGPRPILDFPDVIIIPETAVKIISTKSLLVRNLGDVVAIFNLFTSSPYFSIEPSKGVIEEEETVQFVVNFLPKKTGFFEDDLFLKYDSGIYLHQQSIYKLYKSI